MNEVLRMDVDAASMTDTLRPIDEFTDEDADILSNHLMNLRSQSRIYEMSVKDATNPDTKAFLDASAKDMMKDARALHRALHKLGVRGLGPLL